MLPNVSIVDISLNFVFPKNSFRTDFNIRPSRVHGSVYKYNYIIEKNI